MVVRNRKHCQQWTYKSVKALIRFPLFLGTVRYYVTSISHDLHTVDSSFEPTTNILVFVGRRRTTRCTVCSASDERIRRGRVVVARTPQYPVSACGLRRWKYEPSGSKHFTQ